MDGIEVAGSAALLARRVWRALPEGVRRPLRRGARSIRALGLAADRTSARRLLECTAAIEHGGKLPGEGSVTVRLRPLGGHAVSIRRNTRDSQVAWDTFAGHYHLPPPGPAPGFVLDLGAYTGLTTAHMAALWPGATVLGIEMDPGNAAIARQNVAAFGNRCSIVEAAVWHESGEVAYERPAGEEDAHRVTPSGELRATSATVEDLIREHADGRSPDFVKVDIEGAEAEVLRRNSDWLLGVQTVKVEVHPPYDLESCLADLRAVGFRVRRDPRHWSAVVGIRDDAVT